LRTALRVDEIGIIAMGSHNERHGSVLPPDTDAKLAAHVALEASKKTGAKFLGVLYTSHELPEIDTGVHQSAEEVVGELRECALRAKRALGIKALVVVNGHGGNDPLREKIVDVGRELGIRIIFNSRLIELEGPHAGTAEASMGAAIGIADESKLGVHCDFHRYPEVGFVGLRRARQTYEWAERNAREVEEGGVRIDRALGERMIQSSVFSVVNDVMNLCEK